MESPLFNRTPGRIGGRGWTVDLPGKSGEPRRLSLHDGNFFQTGRVAGRDAVALRRPVLLGADSGRMERPATETPVEHVHGRVQPHGLIEPPRVCRRSTSLSKAGNERYTDDHPRRQGWSSVWVNKPSCVVLTGLCRSCDFHIVVYYIARRGRRFSRLSRVTQCAAATTALS